MNNPSHSSVRAQASDIRHLADKLENLSADELKMILSVAVMQLSERTGKEHALSFCSLCLSDPQLPPRSN